jgi:uncharacterized protein DUF5367
MHFFVLWGFVLWLGGTVLFRVVGHILVGPEHLVIRLLTFVAAIPVIAVTTYPVYAWRSVGAGQRPAAAARIALPGMFLDTLAVVCLASVFPNLPPPAGASFAAWLLWAYGLILLTGLVPRQAGHERD